MPTRRTCLTWAAVLMSLRLWAQVPAAAHADARADAASETNAPAAELHALGQAWTGWFAPHSTLQRLPGAPFAAFAVCAAGATNGWVFRTDRVPPAVRGKHGEIGVLVGLGTDGRVKGVQVLQHHEDPAWFGRLKAAFFRQFAGQRADGADVRVDAVTGATVSSKAIIDDVFRSGQTVLAWPQVKALLKAPDAAP
jgi:hypothetical protein